MNSLSDNLCSIADRWVIEAGRYVDNRLKKQGFLSTQGDKSREIERGPLAVTTHFLQFKHSSLSRTQRIKTGLLR